MARATDADAEVETVDKNGNPRLAHPDVHTAYREDYDSVEEILTLREDQETRDSLKDENRCNGGDHSFQVYMTNLPRISRDDLEEGLLLYKPTDNAKGVYEVTGEPFEGRIGWECPTVWHVRQTNGEIRQFHNEGQFVSQIVDEFTFLQPETVQSMFGD